MLQAGIVFAGVLMVLAAQRTERRQRFAGAEGLRPEHLGR